AATRCDTRSSTSPAACRATSPSRCGGADGRDRELRTARVGLCAERCFQRGDWFECEPDREAPMLKGFLAALGCAVLASAAGAQPAPADGVVIEYGPPANPAHKPIHDLVKDNQGLERVREVLLPIRWPRTLRLQLKGCDGEANAWYEESTVTVCYE